MNVYNVWHHFLTITEHKLLVMKNCFQVGLYRQGLLHDLSKYMPEGYDRGALLSERVPMRQRREAMGYSRAWLHHKGRNKHHFEYWIDFSVRKEEGLVGNKMPLRYVIEMMMDRIAASKIYQGKNYTDASPWEYYCRTRQYIVIHPDTRALLEKLLLMVREEGEEAAFAYMKELLKQKDY
ncbi:MAG: DUF5662 family protein [Lachnospiraceae bacterium]